MKRVFISSVLLCLFVTGNSQNLSGVQNHYLEVQNIVGSNIYYVDSPEDAEFNPGDKVLIIQMTGQVFDVSGQYRYGISMGDPWNHDPLKTGDKNCGVYEIMQIAEIDRANSIIKFTSNLTRTYNTDEKIQLVKFIEYEDAVVTAPLLAKDWDNSNTGGVVAMIIYDTLELRSNIDVSGKGFRGAQPETDFSGLCVPVPDTMNFLPGELNRAGNKGEGTITKTFPYTKGSLMAGNGGGGGNRKFAGGGGGSNYREGGYGGRQLQSCGLLIGYSKPTWGGYPNYEFYNNNKIILGGGGGSGVQDNSWIATKGGDGGGIIIIIANIIIPNGNNLIAAGEDVSTTATASGGGGGAGGTILMDATSFVGTFGNISVKGGKGGNTTGTSENCTGSGGGGSGGVVKYSGTTPPYSVIDTAGGQQGGAPASCETKGSNGSYGKEFKSFKIPINSFLFNYIWKSDTVCQAVPVNKLTGTQPKGGSGIYSYQWQQSINQIAWSSATGTGSTEKDFTPDPLNTTTYFRRIVTSNAGAIKDTSKTIKLTVLPRIDNNEVLGTDSICTGKTPLNISGALPTGGIENFKYQWQVMSGASWSDISGQTGKDLVPYPLNTTSHFRRYVTSHVCASYSDTVDITVFENITGNEFTPSDNVTICNGNDPGAFNTTFGGGFGFYSYKWQHRHNIGAWSDISSATQQSFSPGPLTDTTFYRRIINSGQAPLGCVDTSNSVVVNVFPLIKNNEIEGNAVQYACFSSQKQLFGTIPGGGDESTYLYKWQVSDDSLTWNDSGNEKDFLTPTLLDTAFSRRLVFSSSSGQECKDTSQVIKILINELPTGNIISTDTTICEGGIITLRFNVSGGHGPWDVKLGNNIISDSVENINSNNGYVSLSPESSQNIGIISIKDDSLCFADLSNATTIEATVYRYPETYAGEDAEVCGLTYTLNAGKTGEMGLWQADEADFSDASDANSSVTIETYGNHDFVWTETNWNCGNSDTVSVIFYEPVNIVEAGTNQELEFKFETTLQAVQPEIGTGKWTVSKGFGAFENEDESTTTVSGIGQENLFKWTVTNGVCEPVSDSVSVIVNLLRAQKGFLPDRNEYFSIKIDHAEKLEMIIFNRAGQIVFESDNYTEGNYWNGKNKNNADLPEGTYFYILKVKIENIPDVFEFKSYVELIRGK